MVDISYNIDAHTPPHLTQMCVLNESNEFSALPFAVHPPQKFLESQHGIVQVFLKMLVYFTNQTAFMKLYVLK